MLNCVEIETQKCKNAFPEIEMQKDKTLNSPSTLISFSYNRNKNKNSFTKLIELTRDGDMFSSGSGILAKAIKKRCESAGSTYDFLPNPTTPHPPTIKAPSKNKD